MTLLAEQFDPGNITLPAAAVIVLLLLALFGAVRYAEWREDDQSWRRERSKVRHPSNGWSKR